MTTVTTSETLSAGTTLTSTRVIAGIGLAVLSAFLLTLAFPPYSIWPFIWVAFVPMLLAQYRVLPRRFSSLAKAITVGGWLGFFLLTGGITEEAVYRAYPIERLIQLTGNPWAAALISLAVFVVIHFTQWNLAHIVGVVLPLGIILTWLYLWQRNLRFVSIIHILVNLPMFFIALGSSS